MCKRRQQCSRKARSELASACKPAGHFDFHSLRPPDASRRFGSECAASVKATSSERLNFCYRLRKAIATTLDFQKFEMEEAYFLLRAEEGPDEEDGNDGVAEFVGDQDGWDEETGM